jgi:hypothetical protein
MLLKLRLLLGMISIVSAAAAAASTSGRGGCTDHDKSGTRDEKRYYGSSSKFHD